MRPGQARPMTARSARASTARTRTVDNSARTGAPAAPVSLLWLSAGCSIQISPVRASGSLARISSNVSLVPAM